ncbi:type VII secretion-associated serine protease mycosin [Mycobacterium eburneum]|nr:type VII secretion-associated serine protease mycosin [Mycobacterium eburneum]TDH49482.1 type VII secretion-associated serine protease mycosin [Mycobacterium eburneum]
MTRWWAPAAALLGLAPCLAAPGHAVSPPPIDDTWLPAPAAPAPPQPTVQREVCTVPAFDPQRGGQPSQLDALGLPQLWRLTRGAGQRVAVIDTGVARHRRLPHLVAGGDYVFTGDGTQDCDGHGTVVAGIIGAAPDSGDGFAGVAPEATVLSIRQSSTKFGPRADPGRPGVGDVDTLARAVRTAADLGATVINISSVACVSADAGLDDRALGAALAYAVDGKDAVVVAAAGNTGGPGQCPGQQTDPGSDNASVAVSPAWYDDYVLTVGSVNGDGAPSPFTLAGPWVDVAAPGEAVLSLSPVGDAMVNALDSHGDQGPITGTSYAAPVVSGLAALIRARFPALTARQVMARIEATAHQPVGGWNPVVGNGVVDAQAAVSAEAPSAAPPAQPTPLPVPVTPALAPAAVDRRPHGTAIRGAAVCLTVLVVALAARRLRRPSAGRLARRGVAGD